MNTSGIGWEDVAGGLYLPVVGSEGFDPGSPKLRAWEPRTSQSAIRLTRLHEMESYVPYEEGRQPAGFKASSGPLPPPEPG